MPNISRFEFGGMTPTVMRTAGDRALDCESGKEKRAKDAVVAAKAVTRPTASKVGVATIRRVEVVDGEIPVTLANEAAIRQAFEAAGIEFIEGNGSGEGVRFRKPRRQKPSKR